MAARPMWETKAAPGNWSGFRGSRVVNRQTTRPQSERCIKQNSISRYLLHQGVMALEQLRESSQKWRGGGSTPPPHICPQQQEEPLPLPLFHTFYSGKPSTPALPGRPDASLSCADRLLSVYMNRHSRGGSSEHLGRASRHSKHSGSVS